MTMMIKMMMMMMKSIMLMISLFFSFLIRIFSGIISSWPRCYWSLCCYPSGILSKNPTMYVKKQLLTHIQYIWTILLMSMLWYHFIASCTIGWYDGYSQWSDSIYECLLSWRYVIIIICITYTVTIYLSYALSSANIIIPIIIMSFLI